jgi:hypothetical protein
MTAIRRKSVLGLAVLLTVATAVADTVITAREVISCSVESAYPDFVFLELTRQHHRMLSTRDVYEIRLSDSSRVAELAARLPQLKVTLDSRQPVPSPAVRAREREQLRLDRAREARAKGLPWDADVLDTLARGVSPNEMAVRYEDMNTALLKCGRSDDTVVELLREVTREKEALRRIWPRVAARYFVYGGCGGLLGLAIGALGGGVAFSALGEGMDFHDYGLMFIGGGCAAGGVLGLAAGVALGADARRGPLAVHRSRVNDLVRRVNRAIASLP